MSRYIQASISEELFREVKAFSFLAGITLGELIEIAVGEYMKKTKEEKEEAEQNEEMVKKMVIMEKNYLTSKEKGE
jgi:hypothetical protein